MAGLLLHVTARCQTQDCTCKLYAEFPHLVASFVLYQPLLLHYTCAPPHCSIRVVLHYR
jgi:hypothetical protein